MAHLVVSISAHGFGHVAQTAPILNALHTLLPQLRITVRSAVPLAHLRSRIHAPFEHLISQGDLGMAMHSALAVDDGASRLAYQRFHADWDAHVTAEAALLRRLHTDLVFSNVGYLPLAGAQRAGIANFALCSLNWHDIYRHYCGADELSAQIHACYAQADAFLRTTPGMTMSSLANLIPVAPIATLGRNRRAELRQQLGLSATQKLVLVSMGGIATRLPMECWPRIDGVTYLVQSSWQIERPDSIALESLPMHFSDLLASSDALLCKPGYGSFVEAAYSGVPVLYVSRADWPESAALIAWLHQHGNCQEVSLQQAECGDFAAAFSALFAQPVRIPEPANGALQVAEYLRQALAC